MTRAWVERRAEAAERLEQAAVEAALDNARTHEEREFVRRVLHERAERRARA